MDAEDWLKSVEKKLEIAQCSDREKVVFVVHQLFGTTTDWSETYHNTQANVKAITWNEFKAHFKTHYVPRGTIKLKKDFSKLNQGSMTVNEYLNQFIQLSRYTTDDVNTDYPDFQHLVDKATIIENKLKEMEKDGNHKMGFPSQHSGSNTKPHFS
jgi:hypothetical protein